MKYDSHAAIFVQQRYTTTPVSQIIGHQKMFTNYNLQKTLYICAIILRLFTKLSLQLPYSKYGSFCQTYSSYCQIDKF